MTAKGWVFDIQRFSLHDGPGIRTTVFLKGCPLRCAWCHNPEGWETRPQIRLSLALCAHCGRCAEACERGCHRVTAQDHALMLDDCARCGRCVAACPSGALEMVGSRMTADAVMAVVRRDAPFYATSGGGMTLSGGEPLAQPAFALALLRQARAERMHTVVETAAWAAWETLVRVAKVTDLFLVDLKHTDSARHEAVTGVRAERLHRNVSRMSEAGWPMRLRVPWVPTQNAEPAFLEGLVSFLRSLAVPPPVELMPYHRLGAGKWAALGRAAPMPADVPAATEADVQPWLERLRAEGFACRAA